MLTVPVFETKYAARVPAQKFGQGGRTAYVFALTLAQLDSLLPQRIDEDVIRDANRRLTPSHAKQIQEYLENRADWCLGSLLLGAAPDAVEFEPFLDENGKPSGVGVLSFVATRVNTLRLIDGQHRRRAIQDALANMYQQRNDLRRMIADARSGGHTAEAIRELEQQLEAVSRKLKSLETAGLSVTIYEEDDLSALRRMFADAAKTKPIDAVTKARFDDRNAFNLAANDLKDVSAILSGRVEMERSSVARTSSALLAFNQLSEILRTLMYGYYGRVSKVRNDEFLLNYQPIIDLGLEWADEFLPAARSEYERLAAATPEELDAAVLRPESLALNATVLRVMAACLHQWKEEVGEDWQPLAGYLRGQSFEPSKQSSLLVKAGLLAPGGSTPVSRRQEVQGAIKYIVREAKRAMTK